jgi:hypothetical protein
LPFEDAQWKALTHPYSLAVWILLPISILVVSLTHYVVLSSAQWQTLSKTDGQISVISMGSNTQKLIQTSQLPGKILNNFLIDLPVTLKIPDKIRKPMPLEMHITSKTSFLDSLLQTVASLLINKTGLEHKLEFHAASRVSAVALLTVPYNRGLELPVHII